MTESKYPSFSIIITTVESSTEAESISKNLVENKLAICVNIIGPSTSVYNWKNKLEKSKEYILWIKTISKNIISVTHTIKSLHSYDVPEIISFPFKSHNDDYSQWICDIFGKEE
jgi:periplasmic divalent cation tolerance protein